MVFSSLVFLFLFLPIIIFLYYLSKDKYKNYLLLISSLFFYAWGEPTYIVLMLLSIIVNYFFGLKVSQCTSQNQSKVWLIISIIFNILMLGVFKYTGFIINNINTMFNTAINIKPISLPLGISFFTFQAMSYVIDVYKKDAKVQDNLFNLALYISLFPQLVAGPIVRYQTIADQITYRTHTYEKFYYGVNRFVIGLSKKVLLSNPLGIVADQSFSIPSYALSTSSSWLGIIAYSLQIFFDFSGYSDMAIGLGYMFGFEFLENFNYPYISQSASEFWRRWHISLGSWFRDYVYFPLGGSKKGNTRTYINLFIVWFLTGFWHGASWTFIAWGLYFGFLIALEKAFLEKLLFKIPKFIRHVYLLLVVMIGWVFFRADNFEYAFSYISALFNLENQSFYNNLTSILLNDYWYIFLISILFSMPIVPKLKNLIKIYHVKFYNSHLAYISSSIIIITLFITIVINLVNSTYNPFLYFRF